jgi:protein phosphatase
MNLTQIYYIHEIGSKKTQEDYIWPVPGTASPDDRIFIVCDGVGGSESGEIASRIVAESVGTALLKKMIPGTAKSPEIGIVLINQLLADAKSKLMDYAKLHRLNADMATTFTLLVLGRDKAFIAWCGDSRVYHIRNGSILFRTADHSLVSSLVRSGELTEEEAREHPQKNVILKAVRADDTEPEADGSWIEDVQEGDYFMLCTDGLLENISERDLIFLLEQNDKGDIDLVESFQRFCYDKTKDNYSMYLVKVSAEKKRTAGKRKIRWLAFLLLLLIGAAALIIKEIYFNGKKVINVVIPVVTPVSKNTDSPEEEDTTRQEIKKDTAHIVTASLPAKTLPAKTGKDTVKPVKIPPKPILILPAKAKDSLKRKTDSVKAALKVVPKEDTAPHVVQR